LKTIYFDFDRYDIRPGDANTLEAHAAWLKTNDVLILVEGQCDERGTVEYKPRTRRSARPGGRELPRVARRPGRSHQHRELRQGAPRLYRAQRGRLDSQPARARPREAARLIEEPGRVQTDVWADSLPTSVVASSWRNGRAQAKCWRHFAPHPSLANTVLHGPSGGFSRRR
jgi:hypothetical protein